MRYRRGTPNMPDLPNWAGSALSYSHPHCISCSRSHLLLFSRSAVSYSLQPMECSTPGPPVLHHLPELAQTHVRCISSAIHHLVLCRPLLLLPSIFPSIRIFSNESVFHIRWPTYWSFSFSISPSNEYSGLISFRIDWLDLAIQGTLKSLLQHYSSKASILQC